MSKWLEAAKPIREAMDKAGEMLTDAEASNVIMIFPKLKGNGNLIKAGTRINHGGKIKRATVDVWDWEENNPDNAPVLWEEISYRDGYRIIPATITATLAFSLNEHGWEGDKLYKSLRDGNTFPPSVTPEWWEEVTV